MTILDLTDPQFDVNGGIVQRGPQGVAGPTDPKFGEAARACRDSGSAGR